MKKNIAIKIEDLTSLFYKPALWDVDLEIMNTYLYAQL